ncbi:hypothetical protein Bca4012_003983 [Brassica carinata]|uniref:Uncharacterized protein n=1 Tax=Brassica carinata TaxID=52824 RepID=A0A8X7RWU6_BRACI|nr:hypothetical protein Bca52824_041587 [Brassica carinata]
MATHLLSFPSSAKIFDSPTPQLVILFLAKVYHVITLPLVTRLLGNHQLISSPYARRHHQQDVIAIELTVTDRELMPIESTTTTSSSNHGMILVVERAVDMLLQHSFSDLADKCLCQRKAEAHGITSIHSRYFVKSCSETISRESRGRSNVPLGTKLELTQFPSNSESNVTSVMCFTRHKHSMSNLSMMRRRMETRRLKTIFRRRPSWCRRACRNRHKFLKSKPFSCASVQSSSRLISSFGTVKTISIVSITGSGAPE